MFKPAPRRASFRSIGGASGRAFGLFRKIIRRRPCRVRPSVFLLSGEFLGLAIERLEFGRLHELAVASEKILVALTVHYFALRSGCRSGHLWTSASRRGPLSPPRAIVTRPRPPRVRPHRSHHGRR